MGIITDIQRNLATRWGYTTKAQRGAGVEVVFAGEAPITPYDWQGLTDVQRERLATTCAWVYSDVEELGRLVSASTLNLHHWEGEETVPEYDHELERVLRTPNPHMGRAFVTRYTLWWWLLHGKAFWMLVENNAGELVQFYPLPANRVIPIPHPTKYISGYKYYPQHGRNPVMLDPDQVFFMRFPNIFDYHDGLSPMSAYQMALKTDIKAAEWNFNTFVNEATLRTMFGVDEQGGRFEAVKAEIIEQLITKQMRFMVYPSNKITPHDLGIKHKDMEFLAQRQFNRDEIDRVYGFPEGYWTEKGQRANREAAKATVIEGPVWGLLTLMAEAFTAQVVVPRYGSEYVVKPSDIRPRDRRQDMLERRTYWPVTKLNEARAELGKGDYDGPLADEIAELPVSLATNPQFVIAYVGLGSPTGGTARASGNGRAAREDLRRWKSIERRRFRDGEQPGSYEFASDCLPPDVMAEVKAALAGAETEEDISKAFDLSDEELAFVEKREFTNEQISAAALDKELIELALKMGMPGRFLWPKVAEGLGLDEDKLKEMAVFAFAEPGRPHWLPEKELERGEG